MKKLREILKHKKAIIFVSVLLLVVMTISITYGAEIDITDIPDDVRQHLEVSDLFNSILRPIGEFIHNILGLLLNYIQDGFMELASFDIFSLEPIQKFNLNMKQVLYVLIPLALVVCVILRLFKLSNPLAVLSNGFMTMFLIGIFITIMGLSFQMKNALLSEINAISGQNVNESLSDSLLKSSTVDLKQSIKNHKVTYLSDQIDLEIDKLNLNKKLSRDYLNTRYTYDDGVLTTEELDSGFLNVGKEYYFAYKTDYFALNVTEFLTLIIYAFALFKLGYITGEWIKIKLIGPFFMLEGFNKLEAVGKIYSSGMKNLVAVVLLAFGVTFFAIVSNALMVTDVLDNWLLKAIIIFSIGMSLIVGSGFFNEKLGIDDGSAFLMKSMFAGGRLARMGKGAVRGVSNALDTIKGGAQQIGHGIDATANGIANGIARNESRRMAEEQSKWDIEQAQLNGMNRLENKDIIYQDGKNSLDEDALHQVKNPTYETEKNNLDRLNELNGTNYKMDAENYTRIGMAGNGSSKNMQNDMKNSDHSTDDEIQSKLQKLGLISSNENNANPIYKHSEDFSQALKTELGNEVNLSNGEMANLYSRYQSGESFNDLSKELHNKSAFNSAKVENLKSNYRNSIVDEDLKGKGKYTNIKDSVIGNNNQVSGINAYKHLDDDYFNVDNGIIDISNSVVGSNNDVIIKDGKLKGGKR